MHSRLDRGRVKLLTRTGLDWTHKYPAIAKAVPALDARQAYLDGELCGVGPGGITSFSIVQLASDSGNAAALVFFLFDLLHLDGDDVSARPLIERKDRLAALLANAPPPAWPWPRLPREGLRDVARGHRLETCRRILRTRQSRPVAQGQMPAPRGIRGGRLDRVALTIGHQR